MCNIYTIRPKTWNTRISTRVKHKYHQYSLDLHFLKPNISLPKILNAFFPFTLLSIRFLSLIFTHTNLLFSPQSIRFNKKKRRLQRGFVLIVGCGVRLRFHPCFIRHCFRGFDFCSLPFDSSSRYHKIIVLISSYLIM